MGYGCCELLKHIQKKLPESAGILKIPEFADVSVMVFGYYFLKNNKEYLKWFELGAGMSLVKDIFGINVLPFVQLVHTLS